MRDRAVPPRRPSRRSGVLAVLTAFASGWFAVWFLVNYLRTRSLRPFVIYRLALAAVIALLVLGGFLR